MAGKSSVFIDNSPPAVDAAWLNIQQTEQKNLIEASGQTQNDAILNQEAISVASTAAQGGIFTTDSGAANAYVLTQISPFTAPFSLKNGLTITFRAANANTGACTANAFGLLAKAIKQSDGSTDPVAGMISATQDTTLRYDGTVWRLSGLSSIVQASENSAGIAEIATQTETNNSTDDLRIVTPLKLANATCIVKLGTAVASTSGISIDFTGIPAGTKTIIITFTGVSTNGTSIPIVQIGDSGGIETTGYLGSASGLGAGVTTTSFTTGFPVAADTLASAVRHGSITLSLLNSSTNTWVASGSNGRSDVSRTDVYGSSKSTSTTLDRVRITTVGGTDTFDAGSINIQYQ